MTLAELQARVGAAIMTPLGASDTIARQTVDGKNMRAEVGALIAPNDRLSAIERLEIYSKSYWFRILDSLWDDFPGLAAIIGSRAFHRMARAYLTECPSRSYTMRDLGSRLPDWLAAHPEFTGSANDLALDMARLEWAHMEAYDGPESRVIGPEDLLEPGPDLKLTLQPYLTLLSLRYPVDDFRLEASAPVEPLADARGSDWSRDREGAVLSKDNEPSGQATSCQAEEQHGTASNAVGSHKRRSLTRRFRRTKPQQIYLAVHRHNYSVYYRRLEHEEFLVLTELRAGKSIGDALDTLSDDAVPAVERWFAAWSELGWLCVPLADEGESNA